MMRLFMFIWLLSLQFACLRAIDGNECCRKPDTKTLDCSSCGLEDVPTLSDAAITSLYLNDNLIKSLHDFAFVNLTRLQFLTLRSNSLMLVSNHSFAGLKDLEALDLTQKNQYTISPGAFKPLISLKSIKLGNICPDPTCKFPYEAFKHLSPSLEFLELSVPPHFNFTQDFTHLRTLHTLVLFGHSCSLRQVSTETFAVFADSLHTLEVHDCEATKLDTSFLKNFNKLETLNFACNRRINISDIFNAVKQMPSSTLKTLIADGVHKNAFNYMESQWFNSSRFDNLERLSVRMTNMISVDLDLVFHVPKLKYLNIGYNTIMRAKSGGNDTDLISFIDKHNFTAIDISYFGQAISAGNIFREKFCRDADFYSDDFFRKPPPNIVVPDPVPCCNHTIFIDDDIGDMLDHNIPQSLLFVYASSLGFPKGKVHEVTFNSDNNVLFLDFSGTRIDEIDGVFHGLLKLQGLDLSGCGIEYIHLKFLDTMPSLTFLNLSNNELSDTKLDRLFQNAHQLATLDLSSNRFQGIPEDVFTGLTSLETALLNNNALGKVLINLENSNLTLLDLRNTSLIATQGLMDQLDALQERTNATLRVKLEGNIFQCNCNTLNFLRWLKQTQVKLVGKENLQCDYKKKRHHISAVNLDALDYSCNKMRIVTMSFTPIASIVGVMVLLLLVHNYRWTLKWKFYLLRRNFHYKKLRQKEDAIMPLMNDNTTYNAFVSYNHTNDYEWVQDTLLPEVEDSWGFKLCIGQRDFVPGIPIAENICEAIDNSLYVIIVITPAFISSGWCDFEMQMALVKGRRHMIIIYKEEVEVEQMSKTMRALMSSVNYIEYSETVEGNKLFWQRLKDALTDHIEQV